MTTLTLDAPPVGAASRTLTPLIGRLRLALRDRPTGIAAAERAAECLSEHLPTPDLLSPEDQLGDPDAYQQHVLFVDRQLPFSIVALVWRTGQQTSIHDHRCWGAVAVVRGTEHECRYSLVPEAGPGPLHLTPSGEASYRAGSICAFAPPGDIHRVANSGPGTAISFHVYGADIARFGSSIRRNYSEALIAA